MAKKLEYNNLGAFFRDLPEESPKLAPLLLYVNRSTISSFFKSNKPVSFLIPSDSMMAELKKDFDNKNFKSLDLKLLSLLIPENLNTVSDWKNVELSAGKTIVPIKSITNRNIIFSNGSKATPSNKFKSSKISFWDLEGSEIPSGGVHKGKKLEREVIHKGKFENPKSLLDSEEKKIILEELKKGNFKQLVCDLYHAVNEDCKEVAECLINCNPAAEFFYLFDSPMITYSAEKFKESSTKNCEVEYAKLCKKSGKYLCNSGDVSKINEIKNYLGETHFYEHEYKEFYKQVEENGTFNLNGEVINVCPPIMGKYLYSIECFGMLMKILTEDLEKASSEKEKSEIIDKMIIYNAGTNTKSTANLIFSEESDLLKNYKNFKARFEKCGLCFCKTEVVNGESEFKIKCGARKLLKHKKAFKEMSNEQKQKLIKYLNNPNN